jgi:rubrerythrin
MSETDEAIRVDPGQTVYDGEGNALGTVRGFDEHGFYVTTEDGIEAMSAEHVSTGQAGEAELMWRCWECGEMGQIDEIPDTCPSCGAETESIYYWIED